MRLSTDSSTESAVSAAVATAKEHGVRVDEPRVIRDLTNILVHLAPSPVVARISMALGARRGPEALAGELAFASLATQMGAPVVPPAIGVPPVPHERDGFLITFWQYVVHYRPTFEEASSVARSLRALHEAVAQAELRLPRFDRLEETEAVLDRLKPWKEIGTTPDLEAIREALAAARSGLVGVELREQPLHGDAHYGNVLMTASGPLWADFENVCVGPVEYDLACITWRSRVHGAPDGQDLLAGYGPHDEALVESLWPVLGVFLAAMTIEIVRHRPTPETRRILEQRLAYVRGLL